MAGLDVNGVGATQGTGASYEVKKQDDKNEFINSSFGQGYGAASGEGQVNTQGNQNSFLKNTTYTKEDFAQLKKYGDNIARDLNEANSRLGGQYAKLERDLVRAMRLIGNPDDPNYITAQSYLEDLHAITAKTKEEFNFPKGGKEANYKDAQASVDRYERDTEALLNGITEDGTFVALMNAAKDIKANDNRNAATNAALTAGYGEANLEATEKEGVKTREAVAKEGAKTRRAVHNEGAATRKTVRAEGAKTRDVVRIESAVTRNVVRKESADIQNTVREVGRDIQNTVHEEATTTRETVRKAGQETQEINEMSNQVSDVLNTEYHTGETKKQVGNMRDKIVSSNLPHESKKEMLNDLADFSDQVVIDDHEIEDKQKDVDLRIAIERDTQEPEVPEREAPPFREYPVYEDPYANTETKNPPKTMSGYNKPIRRNPFIKGDTPKVIDNAGETSSAPKTKKLPKTSGNRGTLAPEKEPSILDKPFWKK